MMDAKTFLAEIIDHFANSEETPGDWWAPTEDHTSYCLDHKSKDGTKFWIDLDKDGTITLVWKPCGQESSGVMQFHAHPAVLSWKVHE